MTEADIDFASLPEVDSAGRGPQQRRPRFDGDVSAMPDRACWALQHLLTRRYVSSESDPDIAPDLVPLRRRLMDMVQRPVNIQATRDFVMYLRGEVIGQPYLVLVQKPDPAEVSEPA